MLETIGIIKMNKQRISSARITRLAPNEMNVYFHEKFYAVYERW